MQKLYWSVLILAITCLGSVFAQNNPEQNPNQYIAEQIELYNVAKKEDIIKAFTYLQKALIYEGKINDETLRKLYNAFGNAYKSQQSHYLSLNYFYKELELQTKLDSAKTFFVENNIGGAYYYLNDKEKAREFWEKAIVNYEKYLKRNPTQQNVEAIFTYNNLAVLENKEGNYLKALNMLNEFKRQNIELKDTLNIIMAYENLADVYQNLLQNQTALKKLHKGIHLARKIQSGYDIASLYYKTGDFYLKHSFIKDSTLYYLQNSYDISNSNNYLDIKLLSSEKLVVFYEKEKHYELALQYLHIAKSLSEETIDKENNKKVNNLESEYNQKMEQQQLFLKQKKRERFFISGIILFFFSSIIIFLMFKLQKSKSQKRKIENVLLVKQLEEKNKELTNNAIQMIQTSGILETAHKELVGLKQNTDNPSQKMLSRIIQELKNGTQAFNKTEFEKLFIETDGKFYKKLLQEYSDLTKNEIRLCAFLKMNLSSKEISAITQQSPHSITVARSRLRKKMGLEENQSLNGFLIQF